jgi:hypothetical protein
MVEAPTPELGGGTGGGGAETVSKPFVLVGETNFAPRFFPETIRVRKEREIDRTSNYCKGEDVSDSGSKNREIHINGLLLGPEKELFDSLADNADILTMSSTTWSGSVRVKRIEYEGPQMYHPPSEDFFWEYTLDLVEVGGTENETVVDEGSGEFAQTDDFTTEDDSFRR